MVPDIFSNLGLLNYFSAATALEKTATPDLFKEWELYYQRVGSTVLMKERKIFFGSTKH